MSRKMSTLPVRPRLRRRRRGEDELQRAVVEWLALRQPRCFWLHVPNGGARSRTEAAILQGLGVRAGVPDLLFLSSAGCAGIELKVGSGRQTDAQRAVEREFVQLGLRYAVARDLREVEILLESWGLIGGPRPAGRENCGEATS